MPSFTIDFLSSQLLYRLKNATIKREALARAIGLKSKYRPIIIDTTTGLARDSLILASLGCEVYCLERSKLVFEVLQKGLDEAKKNDFMQPIISRMHLIHTDSITWLKENPNPGNVIYLDPMFPERRKTALVKKGMRLLQELVGPDDDSAALLHIALACGAERVVVKRPRSALELANLKPSFTLLGKSNRFDIYLRDKLKHGYSTLPN